MTVWSVSESGASTFIHSIPPPSLPGCHLDRWGHSHHHCVLHLQVPCTKGLMRRQQQLQSFSQSLWELPSLFMNTTGSQKPCKGPGCPCIHINPKIDPLIG
jgi:hypothetical protein